jgi:hypothetical protein
VNLALLAAALGSVTAAVEPTFADGGPAPLPGLTEADAGAEYEAVPDGGEIDFYPDAGAKVGPQWLRFEGNRVLPDEVYELELNLPPDAEPSTEMASQIEHTVYRFLRKAGYDIATVNAKLENGIITVHIDEGRLEKIVFRGGLTVQTLQFKVALFLDQDIFNRYALERQIEKLSQSIGIHIVRWALVPTANPDHIGWQLTHLPAIEGMELLHEREPYELHFWFEEHDWNVGTGADLRSSYLDGLEIGVNRQGRSLLADGDRWRVAASIGGGIRKRILDQSYYPHFSRAFGEIKYYLPPIGDALEVYFWLTGTVIGRNRPDLLLENYNEGSSLLSGHVRVKLGHGFSLTFGVGGEYRQIFNTHVSVAVPDSKDVPGVLMKEGVNYDAVRQRLRAFSELKGDWMISKNPERPDRDHFLEASVRYYFGVDPGSQDVLTKQFPYGWLQEKYQKVFDFGWNDLWIKSHARFAWGDVAFHDEQPLAEYLRGILGIIWVRKAINVSAEYRFSVTRDVLKLSLFVELAAWGQPSGRLGLCRDPDGTVDLMNCPPAHPEAFRFGGTGGPGIHILLQGDFQLDIYGSFGVASPDFRNVFGTTFDFGALAILNKVF